MKRHVLSLLAALLLMAPMMAHATDGIVMQKGKMMVMKDGQTMPMAKEMMMPNGSKVMKDGTVMMSNGKKMKMTDGMMMDMDGKRLYLTVYPDPGGQSCVQ